MLIINNSNQKIQNNYFVQNKIKNNNQIPLKNNSSELNNNYYRDLLLIKKNPFSFTARPEYEELVKEHGEWTNASIFFRRGSLFEPNAPNFQDIVDVFNDFYKTNNRAKFLIAGVANAQEPFSILATINDINQDKPIQQSVDLDCVDLKPQISDEEFDKASYFNSYSVEPPEPGFAQSSFTQEEFKRYKIKPEIVSYIKSVFNDKEKTHWNTKIEEFSMNCPVETYDFISINNVLYYNENIDERNKTIKNLFKMLKPGGIIITDPDKDWYKKDPNMKEIKPGIWKKQV